MKKYQNPNTNIVQLASEKMLDTIPFSYGGGGGNALMYAPESPKVR